MKKIIEKIEHKVFLSSSKIVVRIWFIAKRLAGKILLTSNTELYLNDTLKLIYVHNPKTAGTSLKKMLCLDISSAIHKTPTFLVSKETWEEYFSLVAVRHPLSRLISSYVYHTKGSYSGYYLKKYPNLHSLNLKEYFFLMKKEPWAIRPQVDYLNHMFSKKSVDYIVRFENLKEDIEELKKLLNLPGVEIPYLNSSKTEKYYDELRNDKVFLNKVIRFYRDDFHRFKYDANI